MLIVFPLCIHNTSVSKWIFISHVKEGAFPLIHSFIKMIPSPLLAGSSTLNTLTSRQIVFPSPCHLICQQACKYSSYKQPQPPPHLLFLRGAVGLSLARGEVESFSTSVTFSYVAATFCFLLPTTVY